MPDTYTFNGRKNAWGEYRLLCYRNGRRYPDGDYHTDDKQDATNTLAHINRQAELQYDVDAIPQF